MSTPSIVLINGSLHGDSEQSNTRLLLRLAEKELLRMGAKVETEQPLLAQFIVDGSKAEQSTYVLSTSEVLRAVGAADGLIIGTGTYWGQGSSTLQRFIEEATHSEGTNVWFGKPAGIIVSEHSTGGQIVLSNLMATLSNFGCLIPPQGGIVYSRTGQAVQTRAEEWADDVWDLEDIASICHKVIAYAQHRNRVSISSWVIDRDGVELNKRWVVRGDNGK